jgi:hypothetical protein
VNFSLIMNHKLTCSCSLSYYSRAINEINMNSTQSKLNQDYILFIYILNFDPLLKQLKCTMYILVQIELVIMNEIIRSSVEL